jgi:pyrroloquinoline quinone (PQQ) biosynthesis protein C
MRHLRPPFPAALLAVALVATAPTLVAQPAAPDLEVCPAPRSLGAARAEARRLVAGIRDDLDAVEDEIRNVPFLDAVEAGQASIEQIAAVAAEQYSIVRSDWTSFAALEARFADPASRAFFGGIAGGEVVAFELLLAFAVTVGLDEADLAAYEPRPLGQSYPSRVAWIAANADRASAAASFLVNFAVFGENMGRLTEALVEVYGFAPEEVAFFSLFAGEIPGFEEGAIEVIAAGLRRGACPRDVARSARLLQAYELDFWLAASEPPGSPLPVSRQAAP